MKSLTAVCQTGATHASTMPALNPSGRISRHPPHRGDGENAEMKMYLSKLKDLVPFMPKNRKLSKLEIIQHVIDYICDLQTELETHPEMNNFDAAAALSGVASMAAAGAADMDDEDMDGDDAAVDVDADVLALRFAAEQEQLAKSSSPAAAAARLPLMDRQSPNTILPTSTPTSTSTAAQQQSPPASLAPPPQLSSSASATLNNAEKESRQS